MKFGDFTDLADAYSESRPKYSGQVRDLLLREANIQDSSVIFDVGAGTGIWTRMLREKTQCKILAVEPNKRMYEVGVLDSAGCQIEWHQSSAEEFEYPVSGVDLITMASSLHWTEYDIAIANFKKALRPKGLFCALWNTRAIEFNETFQKIEQYLIPRLKKPRISSGKSEFTDGLQTRLMKIFGVENVMYVQSFHEDKMSVERYIRIWESVNDVQAQLGPKGFEKFIENVKDELRDKKNLVATYETRAWIARNPGNV